MVQEEGEREMITLCIILIGFIQMIIFHFNLPLWIEIICQVIGMILVAVSYAVETSVIDRIKELERRTNIRGEQNEQD